MSLLILSASNVATVTSKFSPDELVNLMAQVFFTLSTSSSSDSTSSEILQPHRISLPTENHTCLFMPSRIASLGTAFKVVSVPFPTAPQAVKERGLPASTLILDEQTGSVRAIVNAKHLTALRNAAGSLLATRLLLHPLMTPRNILAIGAGAQVAAHISLFLSSYRSISSCTIFNRSTNARMQTLISSLRKDFPEVKFCTGILPVTPDSSPSSDTLSSGSGNIDLRTAVHNADIIVTATSSLSPFFPSAYVKSSTHLCLIGSYTPKMHEIDTDLVKRAGKIVVDSREACLAEAGELIDAGLRPSDLTELGELVHFADPAVRSWTPQSELVDAVRTAGDVTIFKSVGVGVQDVAIASAVVNRAQQEGIGSRVDDFDTD